MGTFRFFLAVLVLVSHLPGYRHLSFNPGVSAVVAFYFLSGWLMTLSYGQFLQRSFRPGRDFLRDRAVRILPPYLLCLFAAALVAVVSPGQVFEAASPRAFFQELLLIPGVYFPFRGVLHPVFVPPAWSLAAELHFYLMLPLFLALSLRARIALSALLVFGQLGCLMVEGEIHEVIPGASGYAWGIFSDVFAYRLPVFGAAPFVLGSLAHTAATHGPTRRWTAALWMTYVAAYLGFFHGKPLGEAYGRQEIFAGMLVLSPIALALLRWRPPGAVGAWDHWLGQLAYPLFLGHFLGIHFADLTVVRQSPLHSALALGFSLMVAAGVERLVAQTNTWRYRLRGFGRLARLDTAPASSAAENSARARRRRAG